MDQFRRQDLRVFRRDPLHLVIAVIGLDLTGSGPSLAVRLYPDAPGLPELLLGPTASAGSQGIRIVEVTRDPADVPTTLLEILATKGAINRLPRTGEIGTPSTFAYDLQWTPPAAGPGLTRVEETVLFGSFIVMGSVND